MSVVNHRFSMIFFCLRFFVVVDTKVINFQNMYVVEDFFVPVFVFCAEKFSNYYYWFFCCCSVYFSIFFAAAAVFFYAFILNRACRVKEEKQDFFLIMRFSRQTKKSCTHTIFVLGWRFTLNSLIIVCSVFFSIKKIFHVFFFYFKLYFN